jgi:hypothetical protein
MAQTETRSSGSPSQAVCDAMTASVSDPALHSLIPILAGVICAARTIRHRLCDSILWRTGKNHEGLSL